MQKESTPLRRQDDGPSASELARNLGRRLRYLRAMRGWTQVEFSSKIPMSRAYLGKLERGNGGLPRYITLVRLAASLGVAPAELVRIEGNSVGIISNEQFQSHS
jgi:transcriptional regulator with XRE-family HTH domain